MLLRLCSQCRRHVATSEVACPFCDVTLGAPSPSRSVVAAGRLGRAAVFAGATLAGTACWTDAKTGQTTPIEHKQTATSTAPPPGTIRGVIRNKETGEPLPGLSLTIHVTEATPIYATSNQAGEYEFTNLPPGEYTIEYGSHNDRDAPQGIRVKLGADAGTLADVRILLPAPDIGPCCKPYGAPPARRRIV